jgi:hypothetical protein
MKKIKVLIDFIRFSIAEKIEYAKNTVTRMTGNLSFQNPDVLLAQVTTAATNLETAYNAAKGGGKQQTAAMHAAEKILDDLLRKQALYVERIAFGNEAMILSAGFNSSHQPVPSIISDFLVRNGDREGEMKLKHKSVAGSKAWIWQYCTDPIAENKWVIAGYSTQTFFTVQGLTPGVKYWFRCTYIAKEGVGHWSDPLSKMVV